MGTNYYVDVGPVSGPCPHCGRSDPALEPLHIGKSSGGWAFCFAPYTNLGLVSWEAWRNYLLSRDDQIRDEYGTKISPVELETRIKLSKDAWTAKTAPSQAWGTSSRNDDFIDGDGFWFAGSADFS